MQESSYTAVMLDLETMSTQNDASIISIGAVKFWLNVNQDEFTEDQLFYQTVSLKSCQKVGLHIDANTVEWWLQQSKEAQIALFDSNRMDVTSAMHRFARWIPEDAYIFGNGATFDNIILRNAFNACRVKYPVSYKRDMCYRTLKQMSDIPVPIIEGTKHNALHDAMAQTKHLMTILQKTPWHRI
jgi:DNA polymerase III epsilon subunit-like protein